MTLFSRSILSPHMTKKILLLLFLLTFFTPTFVFAEDPPPEIAADPVPVLPVVNEDAPPAAPTPAAPAQKIKTPPSVRLINPIGGKYPNEGDKETDADAQGNSNIQTIIGNAIQVTLRLLGAITLAVFFYGGFMWLTSAGSSDKIQKGTKTMTYAVIGLFIIFGAYGILTTIISGITNGTPAPAPTSTPKTVDPGQNTNFMGCEEAFAICVSEKGNDPTHQRDCDAEETACKTACNETFALCQITNGEDDPICNQELEACQ